LYLVSLGVSLGVVDEGARSVATKGRLAPVGIEDAHAVIGLQRGNEEEESIGADTPFSIAHLTSQLREADREAMAHSVDEHKIVSGAVVFDKGAGHTSSL
jgi:hypothetical protein